jgi:hypothetical protein
MVASPGRGSPRTSPGTRPRDQARCSRAPAQVGFGPGDSRVDWPTPTRHTVSTRPHVGAGPFPHRRARRSPTPVPTRRPHSRIDTPGHLPLAVPNAGRSPTPRTDTPRNPCSPYRPPGHLPPAVPTAGPSPTRRTDRRVISNSPVPTHRDISHFPYRHAAPSPLPPVSARRSGSACRYGELGLRGASIREVGIAR